MTPKLSSTDETLNRGWEWAVAQAMDYVREGDPVGDWYEAALPGRNAFCMRDVAHQSAGAQVLGLRHETKNMLFRFAENIAASRDWCTYWEITGENKPAPVDYTSDDDFWYNLPANFDVLDCCWRQYLWTGDEDYLQHPTFLNFYQHTVTDYVQTWDKNGDELVESQPHYGRRGIGSYEEGTSGIRVGGDLIATQVAAYEAYAKMQHLRQDHDNASLFAEKAKKLRTRYHNEWWNSSANTFHSIQRHDGSLSDSINFGINTFALYFGLIRGKLKIAQVLGDLETRFAQVNVESQSYFPEVAYRYGRNQFAYDALCHLTNPALHRREYPEVAYSVVGAIVTGMMGISGDGPHNQVTSLGRLTSQTAWVEVEDLPILSNRISVSHTGSTESSVKNQAGAEFTWKAGFIGEFDELSVNGVPQMAVIEELPGGQPISVVNLVVAPGERLTVAV